MAPPCPLKAYFSVSSAYFLYPNQADGKKITQILMEGFSLETAFVPIKLYKILNQRMQDWMLL